jgi:CubicO group peptidase (beta-lactamase class C family)
VSGSPTHSFTVAGENSNCVVRRVRGLSGTQAISLLRKGVSDRAFPGAACAVFAEGKIVLQAAVGRFTFDDDSPPVELATVFDIASLTKVIATTAMAMLLYDRGQLDLKMPVVHVLPEFAGDDSRRNAVTISMLLAHSSGLPAYVRLFEQARDRESLLRLAFQVPLKADPMTHAEYSDIGFILLGELLQRIAGQTLDNFCAANIFQTLEMSSTSFCPPVAQREAILPTVDDKTFRHRVIQGEVHDENASVLGGVAGHAGVFSNTTDLMRFASSILSGRVPLFREETVRLFTAKQSSPAHTSRALGWDTPSANSSSGKHFSPHSFGHLGYTGTSLWLDGERGIAIALLTNRTWPENQSQAIRQIRPAFHDAIMQELLKIA